MSNVFPSMVTCPRCQHKQSAGLFESLNGDDIPVQIELIVADQFELQDCTECGLAYQPEHPMLFVHYATRTWVVMQPPVDRPRFAQLEREVSKIIAAQFAGAPPIVAERVRGVRPRLVFGQHMLAEAVRVSQAGLDPALLECAKMLMTRDNLPRMLSMGPLEFAFRGFDEAGGLVHSAYTVAGEKLADTITVPGRALSDARAQENALRNGYPELFHGAYVSAARYLFPSLERNP